MKFNFKNIFKKKDVEAEKNKKLTSDTIRVKIYRLINGTAVSTAVFDAELQKDESNNTVIVNEDTGFREEMAGLEDSLISDILYKYEVRGFSLEEQKKKIKYEIDKQETFMKSIKNGYAFIENKKDKKNPTKLKINIITERTKLRLFKCVKYTLENKKGEGYFESIEADGTRSLSYLVRDGDLIPYWYKTPTDSGEPVILVPDIVQRKKFWRSATDEVTQDFNESQDFMWKGVLGVITKGLVVALILGLIFGIVQNGKRANELYDESFTKEFKELKIDIESISQECASSLNKQLQYNDVFIKEGKISIEEKQEIEKTNIDFIDNNNINI